VVASTEEIRERFPALQRRHAGQPVAYFDGPGGTQVPAEVAGAVREYLLQHNANVGWAFPTSAETDAVVEEGRRAVADFVGGAPSEVVFGANMTTLTFHLSRALGRTLEEGDDGLRNWLSMFGDSMFRGVPGAERDDIVATIERRLREDCFDGAAWTADYRRLRFVAVRTDEA
jgi:hypothetical protein